MIQKFNNINIFLLPLSTFTCAAFLFLLVSCAQQVSPNGGDKDVASPKIVKSFPENFSTDYKGNSITLTFDEYVHLKDINNQLIISPPLEKPPQTRIKGKSLIIDFEDKLLDSTTYTFNFGSAVSDITENNTLDSNLFVISTGTFLDSLTISGKVESAFLIKPEKDIYVMLYANTEDSVPYKEKPSYITKTKEGGAFQISNIKSGTYRAFALKDLNNNFIFDQPTEQIAFADSLLVIDTNMVLNFLLFEEALEKQYLKKSFAEQYGKFSFVFNRPVEEIEVLPIGHTFKKSWFIEEASLKRDTVSYWLTDLEGLDTLTLRINDNKTIADTTVIAIGKKESKVKAKRGNNTAEPLQLLVTNNSNASTFNLNKNLMLQLSHPIIDYNLSKIILSRGVDTLDFEGLFNDKTLRRFELKHAWMEDSAYQVFIPPGTFHDIFGLTNDTVSINVKTRPLKYYGNLKLKYDILNRDHNYIVLLMDEKENIIAENTIKGNEIVNYSFLEPKSYKLKIIYDTNNNGRWDTGNYLKKQAPEKVIYYQEAITVRSNWDMDLEWIVEQDPALKKGRIKQEKEK